MDLSADQVAAIARWAEGTEGVSAVRLFGSRAKGTARPDSDVDLAITVDPVREGSRILDGYTHYFFGRDLWAVELGALTRLPVQVERYDAATHPRVFQFCSACSLLLWQRE